MENSQRGLSPLQGGWRSNNPSFPHKETTLCEGCVDGMLYLALPFADSKTVLYFPVLSEEKDSLENGRGSISFCFTALVD